MPFADAVMDAGQPCLEICEDEMDDGQKLVGHFGITTFGNGVVIVTALAQVGVTAPVVRDDQRPRSDRAIDKSAKGFGASVSGDRQPHAPRIAPIVSLVPRGSRLAMAHLDGAGDQNFVVHASAFAACAAASARTRIASGVARTNTSKWTTPGSTGDRDGPPAAPSAFGRA